MRFGVVAFFATLLACTAVLAGTARADAPPDARAVAERFIDAMTSDDGAAACALLTPKALAAFGGPVRCPNAFDAGDSLSDSEAYSTLLRAFRAARTSSASRGGKFVTKKFTLKKLAAAMERLDDRIDVKVGRGAKAARGQLVSTVILDTRTTSRRVVLYAESDGGTIFGLSSTAFSDPEPREAGKGTPEAPQAPSGPLPHTVNGAVAADDGRFYVTITVRDPSDPLDIPTPIIVVVAPSASGYLVDDLLLSTVSILGAFFP